MPVCCLEARRATYGPYRPHLTGHLDGPKMACLKWDSLIMGQKNADLFNVVLISLSKTSDVMRTTIIYRPTANSAKSITWGSHAEVEEQLIFWVSMPNMLHERSMRDLGVKQCWKIKNSSTIIHCVVVSDKRSKRMGLSKVAKRPIRVNEVYSHV